VTSSCVCNVHHHHAYWRLDFDIRTAGNNLVREFNDPPIIGKRHWHSKNFEIQRPRDVGHKRKWRVSNKSTGEAYDIVPGPHDGVATASPDWPFPKGDVWILRYRGTEIDDGVYAVGPPYEANIGQWVNGEPINGADVVVWYGAHVTHDVSHEKPGEFGHIVGPHLRLVKW
jgi:Cu2+-containing amine oxidase